MDSLTQILAIFVHIILYMFQQTFEQFLIIDSMVMVHLHIFCCTLAIVHAKLSFIFGVKNKLYAIFVNHSTFKLYIWIYWHHFYRKIFNYILFKNLFKDLICKL